MVKHLNHIFTRRYSNMRLVLLVVTTLWSVSSAATFSNDDIVYEDGFVADVNYDVHESSGASQEPNQQQADTGLWVIGSENSPSRVGRDLQHEPYEYWVPPNEDKANIKHGHVVKRDVSAVEEGLALSHLHDHNAEDAIADTSDEDHLENNYYYEVPASDWHQQDESLEGHYEMDSHEEPMEERTHGVRARQPRDGEEADEQDDVDVASSQLNEGSIDERTYGEEDMQPRDKKEADNEDVSSQDQVINKRIIRQSASNYEKRLQSAINDFYVEEAKDWSLIEKKKRDITSALAKDYHGYYTRAELEAAVESALNEYYGQKIVNRLKRAAYMELDYEQAFQKKKKIKNIP